MEVATREAKFKSNAKKKEKSFKIDDVNPAIIIKIVSDTYPNPRRTVATEYVQNGLDSHRWADKENVPLDIQLPTEMDPNLIVRDYGIGMTEQDIDDTFVYVFRSTKNDNNDDLGGFGMGKLVFGAYSGIMYLDLFDGKEVQNFLVRLKDGYAGCLEQYSQKSSEPKGVRVTVPVLTKDVEYFRSVAPFQYGFLKTRPNIAGEPDFFNEVDEWLREEELCATDDRKAILYKADLAHLPDWIDEHTSVPQALIGGLPFDINLGTLKQNTQTQADRDAIELFERRFFTLYFGPGEVDIVPSRDNLKYNMKTCRAVLNQLVKLHQRIIEYIENDLKNIPTLGAAWDLAQEFRNRRLIGQKELKQVVWQGIPGALACFDKLVTAADNSGDYDSKFKKFTEASSKVPTSCDREHFRSDTRDQPTIKYIWESSVSKDMNDLEHWMYSNVKYARLQRQPYYSYHQKQDTLVRCNNIHSCLLPLTLGSKHGAQLLKNEHTKIYVATAECGIGNADKRLGYYMNVGFNQKYSEAFQYGGACALYLEEGLTYDEFVNHLVSKNLGLTKSMFVDISTLPAPPATATPTGGIRSNTKSCTEFSENSMFFFNEFGNSPSEAFNNSFWKAATVAELEALDENDAVEMVYVRVKSFRPQPLDAALDTPASTKCVDYIDTTSSSDFKSLLRKLGKIMPEGKTLKLIGVKPKVKMDKLPQIKHLEAFVESTVHELFEKIPSAPPKALTEEFMLEHAINSGMKQVDERLNSDKSKERYKALPELKKLKSMYDDARKAFQARASTLATERSEEVLTSVDAVLSLDLKLTTNYENRIGRYEALRSEAFDEVTDVCSPAGIKSYAHPYYYYRYHRGDSYPIHKFLWRGFWDKINGKLKLFSNTASYVTWLEDHYASDLRKKGCTPKAVFDLAQECFKAQGKKSLDALSVLENYCEDARIKTAKEKHTSLTSNGKYQEAEIKAVTLDKEKGSALFGGQVPTPDMLPLYAFSYLVFMLWLMTEDVVNLRRDTSCYNCDPVDTLHRHSLNKDCGWTSSLDLVERWLHLRNMETLELIRSLPKMDTQTIELLGNLKQIM